MLDINHPEYPKEWIIGPNGYGMCTAFKKFDWGRDDDGNLIDPPEPPVDDPNQLCLPFIFEEIGIKNHTGGIKEIVLVNSNHFTE